MRQPGGTKKTTAGIVGILSLMILVSELALFILTPTSHISRLARSEEQSFCAIRGLSPQLRVQFIKDAKQNLYYADKWFQIAKTEETFSRNVTEENSGPEVEGSFNKELESIPLKVFTRLIEPQKTVQWLKKAGWIVSLVCLRLVVLKFSWVLWLAFLFPTMAMAQLRRKKAMATGGTFSSYTFHIGRGVTVACAIVLPLAYLFSPVRIPVTFFLCSWVLLTYVAAYKTLGNLPSKL